MSGKTSIHWTNDTWNPVTGCTRVSAGCDHCYAFAQHDMRHVAWKRGRFPTAPAQYHLPFSRVQLLPERLEVPLHWRKPRRVFVNSVVERVDLIAQAVANLVNLAISNLHAGRYARVNGEGRHEPCLFGLHLQIGDKGRAEQLSALAEHLKAVLRLHVRVPAQIGLIVQFHCASLEPFCQPVNDAAMCHGDSHDRVHAAVPLRPHGSHVDRPFTVHQSSDVRAFFRCERRNRIRRAACLTFGPEPEIARPIILPLRRLLLVVHPSVSLSVKGFYHVG